MISGNGYRSAFGRWDSQASVRSKPLRPATPPTEVYFPPELVIGHEDLRAVLDAEQWKRLLTAQLYAYLDFTVQLESLVILPVTAALSVGKTPLDLPAAMRRDAMAITTDEAWHGQFTFDLIERIAAQTRLQPRLPKDYEFQRVRDRLRATVEPTLRPAFDLLITYVSETLISAKLKSLPQDERLPRYVREVVTDHAQDENRHHAYFRALLPHFWHALGAGERTVLSGLIPDMITAFLGRDRELEVHIMTTTGLPLARSVELVRDNTEHNAAQRLIEESRSCVRYLVEVGAVKPDLIEERLSRGPQ